MTAIFVLSSLTAEDIERSLLGEEFPLLTKSALVHTIEYGVLGVLASRLLRAYRVKPTPYLWGGVLLLSIGYGATDEFHQSFVPGRDPSWMDLGFDSLGAVLGLLVGAVGALLGRRFGGVRQ